MAQGVASTPRRACSTRGIDAALNPVCDPACPTGQIVSAASASAAGPTRTEDGVPASTDCDDLDASVGSTATRTCTSDCGSGVTHCTNGTWDMCSAPTTCTCAGTGACSPGDVDTSGGACGNCGTQQRTCQSDCTWGPYVCMGEGVCAAGTTDMGSQSCGSCGGTQTRTRTCQGDCSWGSWGTWSTCSGGGGGVCTPGQTDSQTEACGNCGMHTRTRTCASSCGWGSWGSWSACSGEGVCAPGASRTGCDTNSAGSATTCGVEVCSSSCSWGSCQLAPGAQCMSSRGTDFQCCTPSGGGSGWQFCNASTCTWNPCASHSC